MTVARRHVTEVCDMGVAETAGFIQAVRFAVEMMQANNEISAIDLISALHAESARRNAADKLKVGYRPTAVATA